MADSLSIVADVFVLLAVCVVICGVFLYNEQKDKEYEHRRAERYKRRCHEIKEGDPIWKIRG